MVARTQTIQIVLADTMIRTAHTAIDKMLSEYFKKDGVHQIEEKLENAKLKLATHIYGLAQSACKLGRDDKDLSARYFQAICKEAETHVKEQKEVDNVKEVLPIWPVYKSQIKAALEAELLPSRFETYGAMLTALKEKRHQEQTAARGARPEGNANRQDGTDTNIAEGTTKGGKIHVTEKLAAVLRVMQGTVEGMDPNDQDKFAEELAQLIKEYAPKASAPADQTAPKADDKAAEAA